MNETSNQSLVTITPNEEGVSYLVLAYKDVDDSKMRSNIQTRCTGKHLLAGVRDLAKYALQKYQDDEESKALPDDEWRMGVNEFKRLIIFQAMSGASYSVSDLISDALDDLLDALSDDPEAEE